MGKTLDRRMADAADLHPAWKLHDAFETYGVRNWGKGYFGINKHGHVTVHPDKDPERGHRPQGAGRSAPGRAASSCRSCSASPTSSATASARSTTPSRSAITEYDYQGEYCCVYPIKVNQQRHVVEEILDFGKPFGFGLEAGSKPELLAVLALTNGRRHADHLQRLQGRRVHQDGRCSPARSARTSSRSSRSSPSWRLIVKYMPRS